MAKPAAHRWDFERSAFVALRSVRTFSVGVFQWLPGNAGLKKSKSIRVKGYVAEPKKVYAKAAELCRKLNEANAAANEPPKWLQKQYSVAEPLTAKRVTVGDRVAELASSLLSGDLERQGFRQTRTTLWRDDGHTCQTIQFELSRWGTSFKGEFKVQLGVFWHDIEKRFKNESSGRMPPPYWRCTFHLDLGTVTPALRPESWDITVDTPLKSLLAKLAKLIASYGLPYLAYRSQPADPQDEHKYFIHQGKNRYLCPEFFGASAAAVFKAGKRKKTKR
jgi:hypothetical protein